MNTEMMEIALMQAQDGYSLKIKSERIEICARSTNNETALTYTPFKTLDDLPMVMKGLAVVAKVGKALAQNPALTKGIPQYSFEVLHKKGCTSSSIHKENISYAVMGSELAQSRVAALELLLNLAIATTP